MTGRSESPSERDSHRWLVLAAAVVAQAATSVFQFGIPYLLPQLHDELHESLSSAAVLVGCPSAGMMLTLVAWGAIADRWGDRFAMTTGLLGAGVVLLAVGWAGSVTSLGVLLVLAGVFGASVNVTSGRAIMSWFSVQERGLAMGIRQTSPLLGMGVAALLLPAVGQRHGYTAALMTPAVFCLAAAVGVAAALRGGSARGAGAGAAAGAAGSAGGSPYRTPWLWRVHGASALLVMPQITVSSFAFIYLVERRGWSSVAAGVLLAVGLALGGAARLVAGVWSDRVRDRIGPMRTLAVVNCLAMGLLGASVAADSPIACGLLVVASVITSSGNGLAFTAVAETAGAGWAGRALGVQNTVQYLVVALTPPVSAAVISGHGYAAAFGLSAVVSAGATFVIPGYTGTVTWGLRRRVDS